MNVVAIRSIITVVIFIAFIALWIRVWRKDRLTEFNAAARIPLDDLVSAEGRELSDAQSKDRILKVAQ